MGTAPGALRSDPRHGWLAAVAPAQTKTFRTRDAGLAATLASAGARPTDGRPDVELGRPADLRGDALCAVVPISLEEPRSRFRILRGSQRLVRASRVRVAERSARRALRDVGYPAPDVLRWQHAEPLPLWGCVRSSEPLSHRFPLSTIVSAARTSEPTLLEAVLESASAELGSELVPERVSVNSSGVIVVLGAREVVRLALGPARDRVRAQAAALRIVEASGLSEATGVAVPRSLLEGGTGLATWSVETRVDGVRAGSPVGGGVGAEGFLHALWRVERDEPAGPGLRGAARVVAAATDAETAARVETLAAAVEEELASLPRGFVHGDFWAGNLLLDGHGSLAAVIDWADAAADGYPLADLLHLQVSDRRERSGENVGPALLARLESPTAAERSSAQEHLAHLGIEAGDHVLHALGVAYWLQALAREISDPDREAEPEAGRRWQRDNLHRTLAVLA